MMNCDNNNTSRPSCASSSQSSSLHDLIYSVVKFHTEYDEDETYSVIPTLWLREDDKYSYWPRKDIRNCIIKCKKPQNDWIICRVTVLAKYDSYEHALQKEKRLMEEKSNTESESQLGRGFRKKKNSHRISKEKDNSSNSSANEISDNDSIPELNNNLHEQDDDVNQNIGHNDPHILHMDEIPIVIEVENNIIPTKDATETLDSILRCVLEIKLMCRRIDERLHVLENNASEEAQSQLVNMLIMIGGTTSKDAMKRVLQKLFTNNLASKCSWTGAKNNFKLKDLKMIICMKNAIKNICSTITEAQFEEILKAWFRQANLRLNRENVRNNARNDNARNDI
ncbi:uncharacterized protein LOC115244769 isoform X4 [Formica exsecta]|uniref:uncharacterized protein LOC115244769 isoform X4 n=1 Tax=Formica exsecta TaxID=72781 RepID=UPI001142D6F9|nr:uncharacterized protein LOC115244769 isoform X4 [Formica exsecta]